MRKTPKIAVRIEYSDGLFAIWAPNDNRMGIMRWDGEKSVWDENNFETKPKTICNRNIRKFNKNLKIIDCKVEKWNSIYDKYLGPEMKF